MAKMMLSVDKKKFNSEEFCMTDGMLEQKDRRMRFNNSRDPIYYAFEILERRSIMDLVGDLIEDSRYEITKMISKAIKG